MGDKLNELGYRNGVYFNRNIIRLILSGNKNVYARTTCFKELLDKELLLVDSDFCYGTITFSKPKKYQSIELKSLKNHSKIINDNPKIDMPLLLHDFKFNKYIKPKPVIYKNQSYFQEYIPEVCIIENIIKNVYTHDVSKVSDEELINNHSVIHMLYNIKQSNQKVKYTLTDLYDFHNNIVNELHTRLIQHNIISDIDNITVNKHTDDGLHLFKPIDTLKLTNIVLDEILSNGGVSYIIEPAYVGFKCMIHKGNDDIKLFSSYGLDITSCLGKITEQIRMSSNQDFILDCHFVFYKDNKTYPIKQIYKDINSNIDVNFKELNVKLFISDILYYNKDISKLSWEERHKYLNKVSFSNSFKLTPAHIVVSNNNLIKFVSFVSNLNDSDGAILKKHDSSAYNSFVITL